MDELEESTARAMEALAFIIGPFSGCSRTFNEFGDVAPGEVHELRCSYVLRRNHVQEALCVGDPSREATLGIWSWDPIAEEYTRYLFSAHYPEPTLWRGRFCEASLVLVSQVDDRPWMETFRSEGDRAFVWERHAPRRLSDGYYRIGEVIFTLRDSSG